MPTIQDNNNNNKFFITFNFVLLNMKVNMILLLQFIRVIKYNNSYRSYCMLCVPHYIL